MDTADGFSFIPCSQFSMDFRIMRNVRLTAKEALSKVRQTKGHILHILLLLCL